MYDIASSRQCLRSVNRNFLDVTRSQPTFAAASGVHIVTCFMDKIGGIKFMHTFAKIGEFW